MGNTKTPYTDVETVSGIISHVIYESDRYSCVKIETEEGRSITVVGNLTKVCTDMKITVTGEWIVHPKYGRQLEAKKCSVSSPSTKDGIVRYLSMPCFAGIGVAKAIAIVDYFGTNVIEEIIEKTPERLAEVKGISQKRAHDIGEAHKENFVYRELMGLNLTQNQVTKLYTQYGEKAVKVIKETPYKAIYDISGFGFKIVDKIALDNGVAKDAPERIGAAITYALTSIGDEGHCWADIGAIGELIADLIPPEDLPEGKIASVLVDEIKKGNIICEENERLYAKRLYNAEVNTAKNLVSLVRSAPLKPISQQDIEAAIRDTEDENDFELGTRQKQAIKSALKNRVSVITGGPGTGKTTIIKGIVKGWMSHERYYDTPDECILMCAPTGKAARRMSEVTGVYAETIQRIIYRQMRARGEITGKLIILDEASMLDIELADMLCQLAVNNQLVLIGDVDQLPPIGPGSFFRDCVQSPVIPTVVLDLSHRQTGYIAINAKRIKDGVGGHGLKLDDPSFQFISTGKEKARDVCIDEYCKLLQEGYSVSEICCIVPTGKSGKGHTAASDLNEIIREKINPATDNMVQISTNFYLRVGDRVMNTENDYDRAIFNGDCGIISEINPEQNLLILNTDDGRAVEFSFRQANTLKLAYAMTVHKSQGSEYKAVVISQNKENYFMLQRNLLYTAVTRAKEKVIIVGEMEAVNIAISKVPARERRTRLRLRIKDEMLYNK